MPWRSVPIVDCHPPAFTTRSSVGTWRAQARISAHVCSLVLWSTPPVPATTTPRAVASATSMAALNGPVVTTRRSFGSRSSSAASIGVRSRMATTTS